MICLLTGDTHFGHSVKMMSGFSTLKLLFFPFVIKKDLVGRYFEEISCSSSDFDLFISLYRFVASYFIQWVIIYSYDYRF